MNRLIITGGNGFIGRHLVKKILSKKVSYVAIIANKYNDLNNECMHKKMNNQLEFYRLDIRDKKSVLDIFKDVNPDTCVHLAARTSVLDSIKNPDETMSTNVDGTMNVLEACRNSNTNSFVFASSAAVYGDVSELPISESAPLGPLSPYGKSKMVAEKLVFDYNKLNKSHNACALRIFNVYGPGNVNESDVITKFAMRITKGLAPIIQGQGTHTRDFISVHDVIDGILLCIRAMEGNKFAHPPVFNLGSGNGTSVQELAHKMLSISNLDLDPIYENDGQDSGIILHSYADIAKAKRDLKFVPKKDLDTGLREVIEQYYNVE